MRVIVLLALSGCLIVDTPPAVERAHVYSCNGVEVDIFFQLCVRPDETPEDEWARVTARTGYDCHCTLSCVGTRQTCIPTGEP